MNVDKTLPKAVTPERALPLTQTTLQRLLQDIMAGVYAPGHRIREEEVATRLGVGRSSVREALRVLEQDGLVELLPWRGASVVDLGVDALEDLLELLGTVYGAVARLVARHASDAELAEVFACMAKLRLRVDQDDEFLRWVDTAYRMGALLGEASGSQLADRMLRRLGRIAYLQHRYMRPLPKAWRSQSRVALDRLEDALRARSAERSERAARKVIRNSATLMLRRARAAQAGRTTTEES